MSRFLTLLGMFVLAGCGFHLQGAATTPAEMQRTFIETVERNSQFHRELRQALRDSGVDVVESSVDATAILSIIADETGQRVLSVSALNVPTEYEVYYVAEYTLISGEKTLLAPQSMTLTRDYTYDATLVLGKAHEEQLLRDAIVQDLVRIVLRQLSSLQAAD